MVSVLTYGRSHGLKMMKESCAHFDANLRVSDLIDTHTGRWCLTRLKEIFVPGDIKILQSNQPVILKPDSWVWKHTQSSVYSVKTSYELAFAENNQELLREHYVYPSINPLKNQVWHIKAPSKLKVFLWKALSGALPVLDGLQARGMKCDQVCQTCGVEGESINHVLFTCTLARKVWAISGFPARLGGFNHYSIFTNLSYVMQTWEGRKEWQEVTKSFPWTLWYLWKNRNRLLFEGYLFDGDHICSKAKEEADLWYYAQTFGDRSSTDHRDTALRDSMVWKRPPPNVLKCNIGMQWSKKRR